MGKIHVLRDIKARNGVNANEIIRRAYLYVARNQLLPPQVRYQAQLQLNTFGRYTRPTTVKNRCVETGRGRGIMSEFGLCRVSSNVNDSSIILMFIFLDSIPPKGSVGHNSGSAQSFMVARDVS
jgi:small subunit ribosomal protein S14